MKFAANISFMFNEWPALERFRQAADAGFTHVEFLFPEEHDLDELARAVNESGVTMILFDSDRGDFAKGERGYLCHPGQWDRFHAGIVDALKVAERLGAHLINPLAGLIPAGVSREAATDVAIENLRRVAPLAESAGVTLCIEGLNTRDNPGYLIDRSQVGFEIVGAVGSPAVKYLYDAYHMQIMEGNLTATIAANLDKIGHIQISDVPGRHEPGSGEINYANLLPAIDAAGYTGFVSLEYRPANGTLQGLDWLPREHRRNT
ncbi:MAG: hydroxypyruvate isomerase family protein [Chloroflexota bacterium]